MSKKGWKAGAVLAAGAGITAVLAAKKRGNMEMDKMKKTSHGSRSDYRNTELGKHDKNSKGIYYTNGNYEAFARPEKPAGIEEKSAYLVGSGLARYGLLLYKSSFCLLRTDILIMYMKLRNSLRQTVFCV